MFDSIRRVVSTVQTAVRETLTPATPTTTTTTTPVAAPFSQDVFETGGGTSPIADLLGHAPDFLQPFIPESLRGVKQGPEFVHLKDKWTPQGQGYDPDTEELLTTYYNEGHEVLLSVQDKNNGGEKGNVILGGVSEGHPAGAPDHGGGVSTDGEFVYVADTEAIYVYSRDAIDKAEPGETVPATQVVPIPEGETVRAEGDDLDLVNAASYMTVHGGHAYVGSYSKNGDGNAGAVWRYDIKDGVIDPESVMGPIRAPDQAQGVTVVNGALLFTTGSHKLYHQPITSTEDTFKADVNDRKEIGNGLIDQYAQGLNVIDGEVWVTYESGSHKYDEKANNPRTHVQRIPLEQLDLEAAGLTPEDFEG